jgi:hypothetical protein
MTVPFDQMTIADLIAYAGEQAHPEDNPSSENAFLIDELCFRLRRLHEWRLKIVVSLDSGLTEEDGSDLIPDHIRVANMIHRLQSTVVSKIP